MKHNTNEVDNFSFHNLTISGLLPAAPSGLAVIIPTILQPSLRRAVHSIFRQRGIGTIQILIGVDKAVGDPSLIKELHNDCPTNCAISVLDMGYSKNTRNGGMYFAMPGGAIRTILSYAANSPRIAYLDDDNWFEESHLLTLSEALSGNDWAYSLRW